MNILHVWDQAAVACTIAKYQREVLGHNTRVIKRDGHDPYGIMEFYGYKPIKTIAGILFRDSAVKISTDYDVIHVHDLYEIIPHLSRKYPDKKIILHWHGSRLRNTDAKARSIAEFLADIIYVSTPDLLGHEADSEFQYLPNPVDRKHFHRRELMHDRKLSAELQFPATDILTKTPYKDMPEILCNHATFIDIKPVVGTVFPQLSMTGLQALSVGLRVFHGGLDWIDTFPGGHEPETAVKRIEADLQKV